MTEPTAARTTAERPWTPEALAQVQRRTIGTLVASQGLGGLGIAIGIAVAALLAQQLSGSEKLAGLAQTMQVLGAALAAFLLARIMGRRGRRVGLAVGYALGAAGAALCVVAGVVGWFPLLLLGATLLGSATAANSQSRYAATDLARPDHRARSLSIVVWATTVGAVAGPNLVGVAGDVAGRLGLPPLTGPFLFAGAGLIAAMVAVLVFLRPDSLLVARESGFNGAGVTTHVAGSTHWSRVLDVLRTRPAVTAGIAALALGHAVMVAVMVMTPIHMHHGGADLEIIGVVVSGHVLGMFAFSPVVGWGADRFGRVPMLLVSSLVFLVSLVLSGSSPEGASWAIGSGLFLLGLGWSFSTVAASTLLSESAPAEVRTEVQGAADLVMGLVAAAAGAVAGLVMGTLGYAALNGLAAVLAVGIAAAAGFAHRALVVTKS